MITIQLTDDQANLMFHVLGEMPLKHALPLFEALNAAVARSRQPAPDHVKAQFASSPPLPDAEPREEPASAVRANPPPKGLRVTKS